MSAQRKTVIYRRIRLGMDIELEVPEPVSVGDMLVQEPMQELVKQPEPVIDSLLVRAALRVLQEVDLDDLSAAAGCADSVEAEEQLIERVLESAGFDPETRRADAQELRDYMALETGVQINRIFCVEPPRLDVREEKAPPRSGHQGHDENRQGGSSYQH